MGVAPGGEGSDLLFDPGGVWSLVFFGEVVEGGGVGAGGVSD